MYPIVSSLFYSSFFFLPSVSLLLISNNSLRGFSARHISLQDLLPCRACRQFCASSAKLLFHSEVKALISTSSGSGQYRCSSLSACGVVAPSFVSAPRFLLPRCSLVLFVIVLPSLTLSFEFRSLRISCGLASLVSWSEVRFKPAPVCQCVSVCSCGPFFAKPLVWERRVLPAEFYGPCVALAACVRGFAVSRLVLGLACYFVASILPSYGPFLLRCGYNKYKDQKVFCVPRHFHFPLPLIFRFPFFIASNIVAIIFPCPDIFAFRSIADFFVCYSVGCAVCVGSHVSSFGTNGLRGLV